MAQKTNPVSTRFLGPSLWKNVWLNEKSFQHKDFERNWLATHFINKFYKNKNFDIVSIRLEKTLVKYLIFITLRKNFSEKGSKFLKIMGFPKESDQSVEKNSDKIYYPRLVRTLPQTLHGGKVKTSTSWLLHNTSSVRLKKSKNEIQLAQKTQVFELSVMLNLLKKILCKDVVLIKSHPSYILDAMPSADYLAIFVRNQLLNAVKRKKKIIPLRYFRTVSNYLMQAFRGYLRGIRLQIKGRLPKLGGSAGAARSKKQLLSLGYLSTQRLASPIDYSCVDLGSRSGICSVTVWISYKSPLTILT